MEMERFSENLITAPRLDYTATTNNQSLNLSPLNDFQRLVIFGHSWDTREEESRKIRDYNEIPTNWPRWEFTPWTRAVSSLHISSGDHRKCVFIEPVSLFLSLSLSLSLSPCIRALEQRQIFGDEIAGNSWETERAPAPRAIPCPNSTAFFHHCVSLHFLDVNRDSRAVPPSWTASVISLRNVPGQLREICLPIIQTAYC